MKRIFAILPLLLAALSLHGEIQELRMTAKSSSAYLHEYIYVEMEALGAKEGDTLEFRLEALEGSILTKERRRFYSFTDNPVEGTSYHSATEKLFFLPAEEGTLVLQGEVWDRSRPEERHSSPPLSLRIAPQPPHEKGERRFVRLRKEERAFFPGEDILISFDLFSDEPPLNPAALRPDLSGLNPEFFDRPEGRYLYLDGRLGRVTTLPLARISFDTPGTYTVPAQEFRPGFSAAGDAPLLRVPAQTIQVRPRKEAPPADLIAGNLSLQAEGIPSKVPYGAPLEFYIRVEGTGNLRTLRSLRPYFPFPRSLAEELTGISEQTQRGEVRTILDFRYRGTLRSLTGLRLPPAELSYLDPRREEILLERLPRRTIAGPLPLGLYRLIIGLLSLGGIFLTIVVFRPGRRQRVLKRQSLPETQKDRSAFFERYNLTRREQEVLKALAAGQSTKEISEGMHISPETAKKHINNILKKTDTHSRYELFTKWTGFEG